MAAEPVDGAPVEVRTMDMLELPGAPALLVAADLIYRAGDCLAANLVLRVPAEVEVGWTFGWDLLDRGATAPTGEGDVRVAPVPPATGLVEVVLARSGEARIVLPAKDIARFLERVRPRAARDLPNVAADLDLELTAITEDW